MDLLLFVYISTLVTFVGAGIGLLLRGNNRYNDLKNATTENTKNIVEAMFEIGKLEAARQHNEIEFAKLTGRVDGQERQSFGVEKWMSEIDRQMKSMNDSLQQLIGASGRKNS